MYSALAELAVDCIRILLIAYAVYDLSRYCIRTTSDPANPLLDFPSLMYPARIPLIETLAGQRGRWRLGLPTRAVSTSRLANGSQGERTLP